MLLVISSYLLILLYVMPRLSDYVTAIRSIPKNTTFIPLCCVLKAVNYDFLFFFFLIIRRPPKSPLFPYPTLFRSLKPFSPLSGQSELTDDWAVSAWDRIRGSFSSRP